MDFWAPQYTYLCVNMFCLLFPLIFSFFPQFDFFRDWKYFFPANFIVGIIFIIWDILFTQWGIWWFDIQYTTKVMIINLPLEEVLFFICIPYACVFSYYCYQKYFSPSQKIINIATHIGFPLLFLVVFIFFFPKKYPSTTFFLLAITLLVTRYRNKNLLGAILLVYAVMFVPFIISNGVLTGGFLGRSIVNYNPLEHIGTRIYTVPIEDYFYGMILIIWNIWLYEYFKKIKKW